MDPIEIYERNGLTVNIYPDYDPMSPDDWDNLGTIYTTSRNLQLVGWEQLDDSFHSLEVHVRAARRAGCVVVPVRIDDYGSSGARIRAEDDYDRANGAIVATPESIAMMGAPMDTVERQLHGEIETWDQYLQGDVYGYTLTTPEGTELEALWGLYGDDWVHQDANEGADRYTERTILEADLEALGAELVSLEDTKDSIGVRFNRINARLAEIRKEG